MNDGGMGGRGKGGDFAEGDEMVKFLELNE